MQETPNCVPGDGRRVRTVLALSKQPHRCNLKISSGTLSQLLEVSYHQWWISYSEFVSMTQVIE